MRAIARVLEKRSIPAKLVGVPGSNPIVFGEIRTPGATRTIVFYAHYDGQPLDPKEWSTARRSSRRYAMDRSKACTIRRAGWATRRGPDSSGVAHRRGPRTPRAETRS